MEDKALRKSLIVKRRALTDQEKENATQKVENALFELDGFWCFDTYFVYKSFAGEIGTERIIERLQNAGKRVLFPITKNGEMLAVESLGKSFVKDGFGVYVPEKYVVFEGKIDVVITPLVACDKGLNRMGFGKGYYDRFFAKNPSFKVGICHDFQVVDKLSPKPWDIALDVIITDERVMRT
jgi:5-formyltetrahydrofolate cyclo-ligase